MKLTDELLDIAGAVEALKRECGMDPESATAMQNGRYMAISYRLRNLAAIEAELERQAPGWISVKERLPEMIVPVLGCTESGAISVFARDDVDQEGWLWARQTNTWNLADPRGLEIDEDYQVTRWMPLPAPPAALGGEDAKP